MQGFAAETHSIGTLWVGSRDFQLFTDARESDLNGLALRKDGTFPASDHNNLETLVNLMKKSRGLKLEKLQ